MKRALKVPGTGKMIAKIGVKLTSQMIADAVATALPFTGGIASGILMYALFKPRCVKLKQKLKTFPLCDTGFYTAGNRDAGGLTETT